MAQLPKKVQQCISLHIQVTLSDIQQWKTRLFSAAEPLIVKETSTQHYIKKHHIVSHRVVLNGFSFFMNLFLFTLKNILSGTRTRAEKYIQFFISLCFPLTRFSSSQTLIMEHFSMASILAQCFSLLMFNNLNNRIYS